MPTAIEVPAPPQPPGPPRKSWTREECDALQASGLVDLERFELIEGDLIRKFPKTPAHSTALKILLDWLFQMFGVAFVMQEAAIDLAPHDDPTSAPEPDIVVLKTEYSTFARTKPWPQDLQLIIEVSNSTLDFDLKNKASLYARTGIPDYWVLDVMGRRLVVHRDPQNGLYGSVMAFGEAESIAPLARPEASFAVRDAFAEI